MVYTNLSLFVPNPDFKVDWLGGTSTTNI